MPWIQYGRLPLAIESAYTLSSLADPSGNSDVPAQPVSTQTGPASATTPAPPALSRIEITRPKLDDIGTLAPGDSTERGQLLR
jgi:hypothetical protein